MNTKCSLLRARLLLLPVCALLAGSPIWAQSGATTDLAQQAKNLAKYDKNKNGKLDADEAATMQAAEAKAAGAASSSDNGAAVSGEVVQLSPFEVKDDGSRGYYASNTLSGTRLN